MAEISDEQIINAWRVEKHKRYSTRTVEDLLADPIELVHLCLDVACHVHGIDHMASARVRNAMVKATDKEAGAKEIIQRVARVITEAHNAGELSSPKLF